MSSCKCAVVLTLEDYKVFMRMAIFVTMALHGNQQNGVLATCALVLFFLFFCRCFHFCVQLSSFCAIPSRVDGVSVFFLWILNIPFSFYSLPRQSRSLSFSPAWVDPPAPAAVARQVYRHHHRHPNPQVSTTLSTIN